MPDKQKTPEDTIATLTDQIKHTTQMKEVCSADLNRLKGQNPSTIASIGIFFKDNMKVILEENDIPMMFGPDASKALYESTKTLLEKSVDRYLHQIGELGKKLVDLTNKLREVGG